MQTSHIGQAIRILHVAPIRRTVSAVSCVRILHAIGVVHLPQITRAIAVMQRASSLANVSAM
jgi:hypothetical protein